MEHEEVEKEQIRRGRGKDEEEESGGVKSEVHE